MKTLNLFFALLLSVVFSMEIEAQGQGGNILADITLFTGVDADINGQAYVAYNGNYGAIAGDSIGHSQFGKVKIFDVHTNTVLRSFDITPNASGNTFISMRKPAITPNGDVYILYTYGITGNQDDIRLEKLSLNGSRTTIMEFRDGGGPIWYFGGKLYCQMSASQYGFDPRNSGLPNLNPYDWCFFAIDGNTNNIVFANVNSFTESIGEMLLMPNGNIAGKVRPGGVAEGNLYEFDANTGAELGLIRSGNPYGKEKFGDNGDLEVQDNDSQHPGQYMFVYSQSSGWASTIKQTDLPDPTLNLYQKYLSDWEFENGEFHGISAGQVLSYQKLSGDLVHGFVKPVSFNYGVLDMWFNHNGTYTVVGEDSNGVIHLSLISNLSDDTSLIPNVNVGGLVVDGRNGQIYDNGWQTTDPHILTLVMNDADIPAIGTTPQASWLTVPAGYTYEGAFPVRDDGQGLVYDAQAYKDGYQWYDLQTVRVFIKPASEVVGVQENTLADFKVWPNPATDYIKFSAEKEISQLEILDRSGRSIMKRENVEGSVFVGDLTPGIYFIRVRSGNQTGTRKWVKL